MGDQGGICVERIAGGAGVWGGEGRGEVAKINEQVNKSTFFFSKAHG